MLAFYYFILFYFILFFYFFIFLFYFILFYLFIWEGARGSTSRGSSRRRGRSRLPTEQGPRCGAQSQDPGIMTCAEGGGLTDWATQVSWDACLLSTFSSGLFLCVCKWETSRGSSRGRGRSRLPTEQGTQCRAQSQDPGIMTWAEGSCLTNWATHAPPKLTF